MRTVDGVVRGSSTWRRWWSDLVYLFRLGWQLADYVVVGGRVRRHYRAKMSRGETYWVDRDLPGSGRDSER